MMIDATEFIHQIKQHKKGPEEYEHHEQELDGIHLYGLLNVSTLFKIIIHCVYMYTTLTM